VRAGRRLRPGAQQNGSASRKLVGGRKNVSGHVLRSEGGASVTGITGRAAQAARRARIVKTNRGSVTATVLVTVSAIGSLVPTGIEIARGSGRGAIPGHSHEGIGLIATATMNAAAATAPVLAPALAAAAAAAGGILRQVEAEAEVGGGVAARVAGWAMVTSL